MYEFLMYTILRLLIIFGKNSIGCINSPYITYRRLASQKTDLRQIIFILCITVIYFVFASLARAGMHSPYLLTLKFNSLIIGAGIGFISMVVFLYLMGKIAGSTGSFKTLLILWSYTLLPTLVWFFLTSFFYIVLPPPRTLSIWGKLFSLWFVFFSSGVFLWKLILYYLTLRFGLRFDLYKISLISTVVVPAVLGYSYIMYKAGIFRIPFL